MCLLQADVLVCAKGGGGLLKERMALVADLWAAGLRAEMMQQAAPSLTAQYDYAHARHIPWLLIIQAATLSAADTVKVRGSFRLAVPVWKGLGCLWSISSLLNHAMAWLTRLTA